MKLRILHDVRGFSVQELVWPFPRIWRACHRFGQWPRRNRHLTRKSSAWPYIYAPTLEEAVAWADDFREKYDQSRVSYYDV